MNEFSPSAIPNHSSLISMSMQSLKKIGQKLLKLESGNEALTDGRTVKISKFSEGITKYPATFCVAGYKNIISLRGSSNK